jgi:ANTAR domain
VVDRQLTELLAGQAAIAIIAALRRYDEITLSDHLRIALSSRSVIDQAIGIVMAQRRCDPEEAFGTLWTISRQRNINSAPSPPSWSRLPGAPPRRIGHRLEVRRKHSSSRRIWPSG